LLSQDWLELQDAPQAQKENEENISETTIFIPDDV
jgi:hypothetical protein